MDDEFKINKCLIGYSQTSVYVLWKRVQIILGVAQNEMNNKIKRIKFIEISRYKMSYYTKLTNWIWTKIEYNNL